MSGKSILGWWVWVLISAVIAYTFCTVTCAPLKQNSLAHGCNALTIIAFFISLAVQAVRAIRNQFFYNQKLSK